jgi:hypothetical protein
MPIRIVYPENLLATDETIETWFADAVANDKVDPRAKTVMEKALALEDAGIISLGKPNLTER